MPRTKNYRAKTAAVRTREELLALFEPPAGAKSLELNYEKESGGRRNPSAVRNLNLTPWLGTPQEAWARAWVTAVRYLIWRGDMAVSTCTTVGGGHHVFFKFLCDPGLRLPPANPQELRPHHLALYRQWLRARYKKTAASGTNYNATKTAVMAMFELGLVSGYADEFFPRNSMPARTATNAATALSEMELQSLVSALKRDLIALHKGTFRQSKQQSRQQAIMVYFLVLALRTGGNTTPLSELTRGGLKPHMIPGMMRIDLVKHRAPNTYIVSLRAPTKIEGVLSIPIDGVAILNRVLEITAPLLERADESLRDRVWLYEGIHAGNSVICLNQTRINKATKAFVRRHDLRGDDGAPLVLTVSRLRKSKAQQLYKLSGGDLATVAMLLGNTPAVAGQQYMNISSEVRAEGAMFVGEVLEGALAGDDPARKAKGLQPTPVGNCKDSLSGEFAPKDGKTHCNQFLHCFGCPSFAVAGTVTDLHRLFSFQSYLKAEIDYYPLEPDYDDWRKHRKELMEQIDKFTTRHFQQGVIDQARALAASSPHRFWAIQARTLTRMNSLHA